MMLELPPFLSGTAEERTGQLRDYLVRLAQTLGEEEPGETRGEKGERGERGPRGEKGERGERGPCGEKGERGETGAQGPQGERGPRGEQGERGLPGSDADTVTYSLTQDAADGHRLTFRGSDGTESSVTIPDRDTSALGEMSGVLDTAHGGTGQTSAVKAANALIGALSTGAETPEDTDCFISQFVGGNAGRASNANAKNYFRRPMSTLWAYVKGKIGTVLGLTETGYAGTAAEAADLVIREIGENTDLNDCTAPGIYKCGLISTVRTLANCPTTDAFAMEVWETTTNYGGVYQRLVTYRPGTAAQYHRTYYRNEWGGWIRWRLEPKVFTAALPTTGWTAASYGFYQNITFSGASFRTDSVVLLEPDPADDTNLQTVHDAWDKVLQKKPNAGGATVTFKVSEKPTAPVPVRAVVW